LQCALYTLASTNNWPRPSSELIATFLPGRSHSVLTGPPAFARSAVQSDLSDVAATETGAMAIIGIPCEAATIVSSYPGSPNWTCPEVIAGMI